MYVLAMEDADGSRSYYRLPSEWADWLDKGMPDPTPETIQRARFLEHGSDLPISDFSKRTLQVVAIDANYIGDCIEDVRKASPTESISEYHGTWY